MSVEAVFAGGGGVASRRDLIAAGLTRGRLRGALARGQWQQPFSGVIVCHGGPLSDEQRMRCALSYGGPQAVLSHHTAAQLHCLPVPNAPRAIALTVPNGAHLRAVAGVEFHQTTRPMNVWPTAGLRCTSPARTAVDTALQLSALDDVIGIVAAAVQSRRTTVRHIQDEAARLPRRGSRLLRIAIADLATGVRSAGEGLFLRLVRAARLPEPELNAPVLTAAGTVYLDALWRRERVGAEIDGRSYHLDATAWASDLTRQNRIVAAGITLLRFPVRRLHTDPEAVIAELTQLLSSR